jgi:tetratricopeptide (TPR) repeat protein
LLLQRGNPEAAIEKFQMAQRFAPEKDTRVANNLGSALLALGRFEEAAVAYETSLAIRRSYSNLSNLGTVRFYLGDYRGSAELYEQAIALGPEDYRPYANLADAQSLVPALAERAQENYREAARRAEAFLAVQRDSIDVATELAWYWVNLGEEARARSMADTAMQRLESGDHALRLAAVYRRLGDDQRASEAVTRARDLGLAPRFIDATPWLRDF